MTKIIGWIGSLLGLAGSFLLALNLPYSWFGFVLYLLSNIAWIYYGIKTKTSSLVVMQLGFTASSIMGILNWT